MRPRTLECTLSEFGLTPICRQSSLRCTCEMGRSPECAFSPTVPPHALTPASHLTSWRRDRAIRSSSH